MDPKRWARVRELFEAVADLPSPDRDAVLRAGAGDDEGLIREVRELLEQDAREETPLEASPPSLPSGADDPDGEPLQVPQVDVSPYRLLEAVGRGGMGAVFTAVRADGATDRVVALKLVHAGLDSRELLRRFAVERRILAQLEHPHIARLYDAGEAGDGRPFLVMEYVEGQPIDVYCAERGLGLDERIRLFLQVCGAVEHAHQALVIHRDLKPSNILVTAEGRAKLLDFGIAKIVDPTALDAVTRTGLRVLTPEYAAPEQVRGEALTTGSDVYALGVILHELLTGSRPVPGREEALARAMAPDTAPDLPPPSLQTGSHSDTGLARRLKGDLDQILLKALRADPRERYADVGALADDLKAYRDGRPVSARPPSLTYRMGKFVRRRRGGVLAAALVLLALAWGAVVSTWQARRAARERDLAVAVSGFLEELFEAPDPRTGLVRDTTRMVDFLAVAEDRVRDGLPDQARPRARLQLILGTVYRNLARPDRAIPVLREAVASHDEAYGAEHPDGVEARRLLGLSLAETGAFDDGVAELEGALDRQIRLEGPTAANTARLHETLGRAYSEARRNDEALPWLERALEARRAQQPPDPVALSSSLNSLGSLLVQAGRLPEAAPLLEEAADVLASAGDAVPTGVRQTDEGYSRNNLSQVLINLNRRDEAAVQADRAWALLDSAFTGPNPAKATNLQRRATLLATDPELTPAQAERADSLYRASLAMQTELPRDPGALMFGWNNYARSLRTWSRALERPELLDEAVEAFRRSVVEGGRDFGADNPFVLSARADLGKTLVEAGRPRDGLEETLAAFPVIVEVMPAQHPMVANAAIAHATALTANGRSPEAMEVISRTRGPLAGALGEEHPLIQAMDEAYEEARGAG